MSDNGSMPKPRCIDVEAFKVSYRWAIYAGLDVLRDKPIERNKAIAVMHTVFEALDAFPTAAPESPRDWTPCAERLPENQKDVLIYFDRCGGEIGIGYYGERSDGKRLWCVMGSMLCYNVLAWQPLPAPYRADQKED